MKKLIAIVAAALSFNAMALSVDMTISASGRTSLKIIDKTTFTQYYEEANGRVDVTVTEDGQSQSFGQEVPPQISNSSDVTIKIVDKNSVRFIDTKEEIDVVVPASVDKTFTGKVKKVVIASEQMVALYSKSLEREGLTALAGMNINTDEVNHRTSFDFSDYSCKRDGNDLKCAQDMAINIKVDDNE